MTERVKVHFVNSGPGGPGPDNAPAFYGPPERASEGARIAEGVAAQRK